MHRPPRRAGALDLASPLPHGIAAGRLDLDDIGPEVREDARAERRGDEMTELDDTYAGQRAARSRRFGFVVRRNHHLSHHL
jgi:hypothetical protein